MRERECGRYSETERENQENVFERERKREREKENVFEREREREREREKELQVDVGGCSSAQVHKWALFSLKDLIALRGTSLSLSLLFLPPTLSPSL